MDWPAGREMDLAFGPRFPNEYDFTLRFEHLILTIVPSLLFILIAVWYMWHLRGRAACNRSGGLSWVKLAFAGTLIAVDIASLGLWCSPSFRSGDAVGAAVMSCIVASMLAVVISIEHRRSLQSSAFIGLYLLITVLFEIAKTRSYFLRKMQALAALSTVRTTFKFTLLGLLEVPKRRDIIDEKFRKEAGKETVSGFWTRAFFVWLNPTFLLGFRRVITVEDLGPLGPEFSSERLFNRLEEKWKNTNQASSNALFKACFATFYMEFLSVVPPRLSFSGFLLAQPLYLRRVVQFIGEMTPSTFVRTGLILSSVLIFLGIALSRALSKHMSYRMITMVRGALIPHILRKTLNIPYSVAKESAAATLMSTDIEGIATGIAQFHAMWGAAIEVSVGFYLLSTLINQATFLVVLPVVASVIATYFIGKTYAKHVAKWNAKIQERVAMTTKALLQIKSIKMIGLESVVSKNIKQSRLVEIEAYKVVRWINLVQVVMAVLTYTLSPVLAIAGGLFWTTFDGRLNAADTFATLAVVMVIAQPLMDIIHSYPQARATIACFDRLQKYLVLEEVKSRNAEAKDDSMQRDQGAPEKMHDADTENIVIEVKDASFAPAHNKDAILHEVSFSIPLSHFTIFLGEVGSGKTTALRAILGEAAVPKGHIWRKPGNFAYCGQKPWLRNVPIRSNIIGAIPFDRARYDKVINACCLESDFQQLPGGKGDETLAGTNGAALSGGQKQRVALARALYSEERTVVLDDVLSGLDADMAHVIYERVFGSSGYLRKAKATVIFATHSVAFLKVADQALIFNANGTVTVEEDPTKIALTNDFVAKMEDQNESNEKTEFHSDSENEALLEQELNLEESLKSRSRSDFSLYKYLIATASKWKGVFWLVCMVGVVGAERLPEVFLRIWIEIDPTNNRYFGGYAGMAGVGFLITGVSTWLYFLNLVPESGVTVHTDLLDTAIGAKLSFLTSTDTGNIINRFSQDMTILTANLPKALYMVVYVGTYALYDTGIIVSGAKYAGILVPFIICVFYALQTFYLRTSRQMRHLDIEAKAPLYTLFTETSTPNGLEHIRAFGWQFEFTKESMRALDYSQIPYYYMYTIQRWLELSMDLIGLFVATILICITTFFRQTTSQAGLGLSLLNLVTYSNMVNILVAAWTNLETSLGAILRLRTFVNGTPQENGREEKKQTAGNGTKYDGVSPPLQWPESGSIRIANVNAKYQSTGPPVLKDVTATIDAGQKVGITGRSGSGKSSLLLTILGLLEYTGTIEVDGIEVSSIPKHLLRSRITTISQDAVLLAGTVRDNLLPYEGQAEDARMDDTLLLRTLERVGLSETVNSKGGLDASLSDMSLSEGQMQFMSLARAVLHNCWTRGKLVLMDEPTSNMDYDTDARIQKLVREAFLGCTIVIISHRPDNVADVDVHLEVANGIVARREAGDIVQSEGM